MSKRYLTCAETAKLVRSALKAAHPGVKFSVKSHTYAGGASMRVTWTDGPTGETVDRLVKLYTGGSFDGMTDVMSYHDSILARPDGMPETVHFGADFIFTERTVSDAFTQSLEPRVLPGMDHHASQCDGCGNWLAAGDRFYAKTEDSRGGMCCSTSCAARYLARRTDATRVAQ